MAIKQAHLTIYGHVQGVYYRKSAVEAAQSLDLQGFVTNKPDGSVELIAQGKEENIQAMIQWCHKGPMTAKVEKIDVSWTTKLQDFHNFHIR